MKGIVLAGGLGTRLYPLTKALSKQLLPVYDKPMIYYPISVLMLSRIREILIISTERDINLYKDLLGDGSHMGLSFSYAIQKEPKGLGEAFVIGKNFIGKDSVCLILGDNIFYGHNFSKILIKASKLNKGALIFGYFVKDPKEFGVVEFDTHKNVLSLEEKPKEPKSNYAIPGLYFYDNTVVNIAQNIEPSKRGELEITSINMEYLKMQRLRVELFGRGMTWFDTGSYSGLLEASNFVEAIQNRQGLYIACLEEIAYRLNYISKSELLTLANPYLKTEYGRYLEDIANN